MTSDKKSKSKPADSSVETPSHPHGRLGLTLSWETVPWWGIIILIVGVIVAYSVLTSTRYMDAIYFIFDLPWNRQLVGRTEVKGVEWSVTTAELTPGQSYRLYAEFVDKTEQIVGEPVVYQFVVTDDAQKIKAPPLPFAAAPAQVKTTTPTFTGPAAPGALAVALYDDFSDNVWRILVRIWNANGVLLTIKVTLLSFAGALVLGLIFGIMRVSSGSPDLTIHLWPRLLIGLGLVIVGWAILWVALTFWIDAASRGPLLDSVTDIIINPVSMALVLLVVEVIMFLLPAMPYTISTLYVEIVRGVPMLVTIMYMGFVFVPFLRDMFGINLQGLPAAIIGLSFGYGAYLAEVFRAGIQSIHHGQMEAARSLGMSYFQAMRHIILPQAFRVVLPPLGNDFMAMLKDSSLISVVALPEILQQGRLWVSRTFRAFEGYNTVALFYLVMTLLLSLLVRYIERKIRCRADK